MASDNVEDQKMNELDDYAEPLLQLQSLTKSLERALLHKDNKEAFKLSTDAVNVSIRLQNWTFRNME
jgi:hypothetical protein